MKQENKKNKQSESVQDILAELNELLNRMPAILADIRVPGAPSTPIPGFLAEETAGKTGGFMGEAQASAGDKVISSEDRGFPDIGMWSAEPAPADSATFGEGLSVTDKSADAGLPSASGEGLPVPDKSADAGLPSAPVSEPEPASEFPGSLIPEPEQIAETETPAPVDAETVATQPEPEPVLEPQAPLVSAPEQIAETETPAPVDAETVAAQPEPEPVLEPQAPLVSAPEQIAETETPAPVDAETVATQPEPEPEPSASGEGLPIPDKSADTEQPVAPPVPEDEATLILGPASGAGEAPGVIPEEPQKGEDKTLVLEPSGTATESTPPPPPPSSESGQKGETLEIEKYPDAVVGESKEQPQEEKTLVLQPGETGTAVSAPTVSQEPGMNSSFQEIAGKSIPDGFPLEQVKSLGFLYGLEDEQLCADYIAILDDICSKSKKRPIFIKRAFVKRLDPEINAASVGNILTETQAVEVVCIGDVPDDSVREIGKAVTSLDRLFRYVNREEAPQRSSAVDLIAELMLS